MSFGELGTLYAPNPLRVYDYSNFDPEDEKYGDYDSGQENEARHGFQVRRWGGSKVIDTEDDAAAGHGSDADAVPAADHQPPEQAAAGAVHGEATHEADPSSQSMLAAAAQEVSSLTDYFLANHGHSALEWNGRLLNLLVAIQQLTAQVALASGSDNKPEDISLSRADEILSRGYLALGSIASQLGSHFGSSVRSEASE